MRLRVMKQIVEVEAFIHCQEECVSVRKTELCTTWDFVHKKERVRQIIEVAIPENRTVGEKEDEQVEKYQDLAREVGKVWGVRTEAIPVVLGALGSIPRRLKDNLRTIEVVIPVELI